MLNDRDKYLLYSELAKLSEAGFPINNAAEAILDTRPPNRQANFLKEIINGIESKKSLTETINSLSSRLSPLEISLINAGEKSGKIPEISVLVIEQAIKMIKHEKSSDLLTSESKAIS